jgi:hypothetical protein
MTSGQFAVRYPGLIQMAFYTGYKKIHGLKNQSTGAANGLCVSQTSAFSCRCHDILLFQTSNLHTLLTQLSYLKMLGDSAHLELASVTAGGDVGGIILTLEESIKRM